MKSRYRWSVLIGLVGLVGLGVGAWLGCRASGLQGWLPAGQPKVIAIGDGAEAFVCSTLEEFQVARVGESGVRWTRSAPGGSSCGEFGGKVLTVAERVAGVDELVYLDAADGRERWRVTPGGSAWRTFQVGTWRVDYRENAGAKARHIRLPRSGVYQAGETCVGKVCRKNKGGRAVRDLCGRGVSGG